MKSRFKQPIPLSPRLEIERFDPYQPGLSIEEIRRQYNLKTVTKMASNENPWGTSSRVLSSYKKAAQNIFRYPDARSIDLRHVIADAYKLDFEEVIIGAGSDEIIELLAKTYLTPADEIVVSASSFIQYRSAGHLMGARVVAVPMQEMKHDLLGMAAMVTEKTKFVFVANPNNPTGTYNTRVEVEAFLKKLPWRVLPVFDEAYFEYAALLKDYPSMIEEFFKRRPLIVLRTFSKVFGLAGLRVGYGVAPEEIVRAMDKVRPPFNVSIPAQIAARTAFYDRDHVKKSVTRNLKEKKFLLNELKKMGVSVVPSAANFILFDVSPMTGRVLFQSLLRRGIITRAVEEYGLANYLRVTIGQHHENKAFLKAFREVKQQK